MPKAATKQPKPISERSQRVINQIDVEFSPEIIKLGNNLSNEFSRQEISQALAGNKTVIVSIAYRAKRKGWVGTVGTGPNREPDMRPVVEALKWMQLMRSAH